MAQPKRKNDNEETSTVEPRRSGRIAASKVPPDTKTEMKKAKTTKESKESKENKNSKGVKEAKEIEKLEVGDMIPSFKLKDEDENEVDTATIAEDHGVVLFAYPKASTPGCTTQACTFRDQYEEFKENGYEIWGISADLPKAQKTWKTKNEFQYHLLSDPEHLLLGPLGASKPGKGGVIRSHWIIEKDGRIADINVQISPKDSPKKALEFVSQ